MRKLSQYVLSATVAIVIPMSAGATDLETITVVGSRTERPLKEIAATIDVIDSDRIEEELARDIADLVRFEPGVTVSGTGSRFGLSGFNIRGIGGNRVLTLVDGVRVAEEFSFGPFLSSRRDFVDIDSLASAEIARGPISSLWGSDALGGVVSFNTLSPSQFLQDDTFYSSYKVGYSSADESAVGTVTIAGKQGSVSTLLVATLRDGQETENNASAGPDFGSGRTQPDEQDSSTRNITAKLSWDISEKQRLGLALDSFKSETDTNILSDYGIFSRGTLVNSRTAEDERDRTRVTLRYEHSDIGVPLMDNLIFTAYWQDSESFQDLTESRTPPPYFASQTRKRLSTFQQEIVGATAQFSSAILMPKASHTLTYGIDYYETSNESVRDGGTRDSLGNPVFEFSPLPTRDFPKTDVENLAFYIQDEIELFDGKLLLSPGARYDRNEATTAPDSLYLLGNPGVATPVDYEESELTLKFGAIVQLTDLLSAFGRYSEGFRAPPFDDVNLGFTNFLGGYKTISAPDLTSETSDSFEVGLRFLSESAEISVTAFSSDYDDFIASAGSGHCPTAYRQFGCFDPVDGFLVFQSENISRVSIDGVELRFLIDMGVMGLDNFGVRGAVAYADGEDEDTGEPLDTIQPLTAVLGLSYDSEDGKWGGQLIWTGVKAKDSSDISAGSALRETSGYGLLDLIARYQLTESLSANAGVYNLMDKTYIRWADTAGIGRDAADRFTQPGTNFSIGLKLEL